LVVVLVEFLLHLDSKKLDFLILKSLKKAATLGVLGIGTDTLAHRAI
jgi:hypothetical protein